MKRLLPMATWAVCGAVTALALWLVWSHTSLHSLGKHYSGSAESVLDSAERQLNNIYGSTRPFLYRWPGVPFGLPSTGQIKQSALEDVLAGIEKVELSFGRSARTLQLRARAQLLTGQYSEAIANYKALLLMSSNHATSKLELGLAFALRAASGPSALDYEFALEAFMEAAQEAQIPEAEYDAALMLEQIPLPYQALKKWEEVLRTESSTLWRHEAEARLGTLERRLQSRQHLQEEITASPESYLFHSASARNSAELVMGVAIEEWLPQIYVSEEARAALVELGKSLRTSYNDLWLQDIMKAPLSHHTALALTALSEASKENARGDHIRAETSALVAEHMFSKLHNQAGVLRARFERSYSLDRRERPNECLKALSGVRDAARRKSYTWIVAKLGLRK